MTDERAAHDEYLQQLVDQIPAFLRVIDRAMPALLAEVRRAMARDRPSG